MSSFPGATNQQISRMSRGLSFTTLRILPRTDVEDHIHCTLVMGKSSVTALKTITVPRLELTAATWAVKVNKHLYRELQLPINKIVLWTDSTVVHRYLRNTTRRFQTFVAHRLQLIHDFSTPSQWTHVPTDLPILHPEASMN